MSYSKIILSLPHWDSCQRLLPQNTINSSQETLSSQEPSSPAAAGPEQSKTAATQKRDLKTNYMKMKAVLKDEMSKSLKEG